MKETAMAIVNGFKIGIRTRDINFISLLIISIVTVPIMIGLEKYMLSRSLIRAEESSSQYQFWIAILFCVYTACFACYRAYRVYRGEVNLAKIALKKYDALTYLLLVLTVASLLL